MEGVHYRRIDSDWLMQAFFMTVEGYLAEHPNVCIAGATLGADGLSCMFRVLRLNWS